jgi:2-polyprenyl-3-methyl-5-hydroxy-6-metoxy-1,4-benzoquinol methylase
MAEFFAVSEGMESLLPKMKKNLEQGYSILIFPEGTRSPDGRVQRFHKGAFLMAQELNADILPVIIHGSGQVYPKGEYFLRVGKGTIRFLPRIHPDDQRFGTELLEKSRNIRRYMAEEYEKTAREAETPAYFREVLIKNYIYKGPVLEWYLKVKIRLEKNYELFHRHLPVSGQITDIGCGYGFMSYMMMFLSRHRRVTGIDYDEEKIATARNCAAKNDRIDFIHGDVVEMELEPSRAFILADVLHYFPEEDQERLILKCISKLEDDGVLMIRDGDRQMGRKHSGTRLSEFFSTRIGFNRTRDGEHRLFFTSREKITTLLISQGLEVEVIDDTKLTSNLVYVARKSITKPSL